MTEKEMQEYACKELLKKVVDNSPNYTKKIKDDLKCIRPWEIPRRNMSGSTGIFRYV